MTLYLDTSVMVSLFLPEARSEAVAALVGRASDPVIVSDLAGGEFSAAISTAIRTGRLGRDHGEDVLRNFDTWITDVRRMEVCGTDARLAIGFVRRIDLGLLFPEALHLALCSRVDAHLVTGDQRQALAANAIGIDVTLLQ